MPHNSQSGYVSKFRLEITVLWNLKSNTVADTDSETISILLYDTTSLYESIWMALSINIGVISFSPEFKVL